MKRKFIVFHREAGAGGAGGGGSQDERAQLMESIKTRVKEMTKDFTNKTDVEGLINGALNGLNLDGLRSFDPSKMQDTVKNLAASLEKATNQRTQGAINRRAVVKEVIDANMKNIEGVFNSRSGHVQMNMRAVENPMTTANTLELGEELPEDILESFSVDSFVKKRRPVEFIFNMVSRKTVSKVSQYKTWLEEGTEDGSFAIVTENGLKPALSKKLVRNHTEAFKVAGKRVYTEEFVKFRQEIYGILEDLFNDKLTRDYAAILVTRLDAAAAAYVGSSLDDQYAADMVTDYHAIAAVAAQIEALDFLPDLLIMNPQDKWRIGMSQNANGDFYTAIPVYNPSGEVSLLGFRVVTSNRVAVGSFYLGESGLYKVEDEAVSVRIGYGINVTTGGDGKVTEVTSDFDNNRFRIISEFFAHSYIATNHAGSFVKATFADVKAAVTAP